MRIGEVAQIVGMTPKTFGSTKSRGCSRLRDAAPTGTGNTARTAWTGSISLPGAGPPDCP